MKATNNFEELLQKALKKEQVASFDERFFYEVLADLPKRKKKGFYFWAIPLIAILLTTTYFLIPETNNTNLAVNTNVTQKKSEKQVNPNSSNIEDANLNQTNTKIYESEMVQTNNNQNIDTKNIQAAHKTTNKKTNNTLKNNTTYILALNKNNEIILNIDEKIKQPNLSSDKLIELANIHDEYNKSEKENNDELNLQSILKLNQNSIPFPYLSINTLIFSPKFVLLHKNELASIFKIGIMSHPLAQENQNLAFAGSLGLNYIRKISSTSFINFGIQADFNYLNKYKEINSSTVYSFQKENFNRIIDYKLHNSYTSNLNIGKQFDKHRISFGFLTSYNATSLIDYEISKNEQRIDQQKDIWISNEMNKFNFGVNAQYHLRIHPKFELGIQASNYFRSIYKEKGRAPFLLQLTLQHHLFKK